MCCCKFWPAFLVLVFLVPVPGFLRQELALPMQTITAQATQSVAELFGMNVERWGNTLAVNGTQIAVAEACNGMRMVFTLILVSFTFAFITPSARVCQISDHRGQPADGDFVQRAAPGSHRLGLREVFPLNRRNLPLSQRLDHARRRIPDAHWRREAAVRLMIPVAPTTSQSPDVSMFPSPGNSAIAPLLAACLLLAGAGVDRLASPAAGDAVPYLKAVRDACDATPKRLGPWWATDVPVPASAVTLLRPNALLSREYVNLDNGAKATFLLVHCGDARDILGHYPPVCYPSAGWVEQSREPKQWSVNGISIPGFEYRFAAVPASGLPSLVVMNTMLLPDGRLSRGHGRSPENSVAPSPPVVGSGSDSGPGGRVAFELPRDAIFISMVQMHWSLLKTILHPGPATGSSNIASAETSREVR